MSELIPILQPRTYYKPLEYPWAVELWKQHESMHWLGHEVPMGEDVSDWNTKLTDSEKKLLTHLFRFFTQADVDVAGGYNSKFLPYFAHKPELAMMMSSFSAREAVHIDAYALLLETVGMPETTYQQFHSYKEMQEKHEFVENFDTSNIEETLLSLAVYSGFTEGMQLFSSFVVLLNFPRFNKMKAMGNIIAWSVRDEDLHVEGMTKVFRSLMEEYLETLPESEREKKRNELKAKIRKIAMEMVELEDHFIDLMYSDSNAVEGLSPDEVKTYIRFVTNKRWAQLGFEHRVYLEVEKNNLPWVDFMVNGEEHTNFFEQKATAYAKAATQGTMEDVQWSF